jgi:hypothetical protein
MSNWFVTHKTEIAAVVTVLIAASGAAPPPYNTALYFAAVVLAYLAQSPLPAAPK